MEARVRIYADGGNRLTKIMEDTRKPFDFPTVVSEPEMDLNYGLDFDFAYDSFNEGMPKIEINSLLVEIVKDGQSIGKNLVGKSAENKGLLIRDRNRYQEKAADEVIMFSIISGIAYNFLKQNKNYQKVDLTINQPLIEYSRSKEQSAAKYLENFKGNFKIIFYNIFRTSEIIEEIVFDVEKIFLCPEGISAFYKYAINEEGYVKAEYQKDIKTILWDIGSGQTNVAAFDGMRVVGVNTYEKGMFDCYEKISIITYNNYRDKMDRKPHTYEIDNIIRFNNCILKAKKGEDIDISGIVDNVFDVFAYEINKDIREFSKIKFLGNCDNVIFTGGGGKIVFDFVNKYLDKDFNCTKSSIGEYDNVIGSMYYRMYKDIRVNREG